jgi:hypothetical protein
MTRQSGSLWPSFAPAKDTPYELLRQQADLFADQTSNKLYAEVRSRPINLAEAGMATFNLAAPPWLRHSLLIVVPALENYRYELLWAQHAVDKPYPATLGGSAFGDRQVEANKPDDFVDRLREGLESQYTKQIVASLLAQSGNYV